MKKILYYFGIGKFTRARRKYVATRVSWFMVVLPDNIRIEVYHTGENRIWATEKPEKLQKFIEEIGFVDAFMYYWDYYILQKSGQLYLGPVDFVYNKRDEKIFNRK